MRIVIAAVFGWIALCVSSAGSIAGEAPTIFIVDATAQMSAKLGQLRKIDAVKNAAAAAAVRMQPEAPLALWSFGTDPAQKCEDIRQLVPLQSANRTAPEIEKALGQIEPRAARAPIFGTIRAALESLREPKDTAISAIVMAGTGDDCIGDICGEAKRLNAAFPNAKLTVFGAGMSEQSAANFSCASKAMGGTFTAIKSGSELDKLLRKELGIAPNAKPVTVSAAPVVQAPPAVQKKNAGPVSPATPGLAPPPPASQPQPEKTSAPAPEPNVLLSATLAPGLPALETGVSWLIYKIEVTPTGQSRVAEIPSWTAGGGDARFLLPDGRYSVKASYGYATAIEEIAVAGAKVEKAIVLNAGTIAAKAVQAPHGEAVKGALVILSRRGPSGLVEELGRSTESPASFYVNAGDFSLAAAAGQAKSDANIKVEAGKTASIELALNAGAVEIETFAGGESRKPVSAWHRIYPVSAEPGKAPAFILSVPAQADRIELPAGNYRVETVLGDVQKESTVTVNAGQTASLGIDLDAGQADLTFPSGNTPKLCTAYEAGKDHKGRPAGRASGRIVSFILKAGLYDVECHGLAPSAPVKQTQIRVVAGQTLSARLEE